MLRRRNRGCLLCQVSDVLYWNQNSKGRISLNPNPLVLWAVAFIKFGNIRKEAIARQSTLKNLGGPRSLLVSDLLAIFSSRCDRDNQRLLAPGRAGSKDVVKRAVRMVS